MNEINGVPRAVRLAGPLLLAAGLALLLAGALRGEVRAGLFFVVPFVYGEGPLAAVGVLALMAGLLLTFLARAGALAARPPLRGDAGADGRRLRPAGVVERHPPPARDQAREWPEAELPDSRPPAGRDADPATGRRVRHGGVLFIGPIPVVWGSDAPMAKWAAALGLLTLGLVLLLLWL